MQYQMIISARSIFTIVLIFIIQLTYAQKGIQSSKFPDPARFEHEIQQFINWDQKNTFPEDAFLIVGSSSIRMWETSRFFPEYKVINRGFGGAHISDIIHFFDSVVSKYKPRVIIFYAGDNDVASGKKVDHVFADYAAFVTLVEEKCPQASVIFISIKPSLARWDFWPQMEETNQKIEAFSKTIKQHHYVDISSVMLDKNNRPDSSLFIDDGLHLNEKGYRAWAGILTDRLKQMIRLKEKDK